MQHTAEEMFHWSVPDVLVHVRHSMPSEWTLDVKHDDTTKVFACIVRDADEKVQWEEEHSDLRLLLFDFYGWLAIRNTPTVSPAWGRPREAPPRVVRDPRATAYPDVPDPGDLDPEEVASLYRRR